jgi:hypothetical protein
MRQRLIAVTLLAAVAAAGCATPHRHGGQLVAEHPPREAPALGRTRIPAVYALFAWQPPPADVGARRAKNGWRLGEWRLGKGELLGFREAGGEVVAVAGADETRLPPGRYCWHTRPGTEPLDVGGTLLLVGVFAAVIGFAVWAAASVQWDFVRGYYF